MTDDKSTAEPDRLGIEHSSSSSRPTATDSRTPFLLAAGAVAGPLFIGTVLVQQAVRSGFDPRFHALSMLSLGGAGWIQVTNFLLSGGLVILGAVGLRTVLAASSEKRGARFAPLLIGTYGVGLIWGGVFPTDPALGFPEGASAPPTMTWHAVLHNLSPTFTGVSLIAACLVLARRYKSQRRRGILMVAICVPIAYLGLGTAAFPLDDLRWLLAGGAIIWLWPSLVMMDERRSAPQNR